MDFATILERYGLAAVITLALLFRVIPRMIDAFKAEQDANRKLWAEQMAAERKECRELHEQAADDRQAKHVEVMADLKEGRHEVKQLAHAAGLKRAVDEIRALQQQPFPEGAAPPRAGG